MLGEDERDLDYSLYHELARRYRARCICYGVLNLYPFRQMKLESLLNNPHLHKVFSRDGVYIFQVRAGADVTSRKVIRLR